MPICKESTVLRLLHWLGRVKEAFTGSLLQLDTTFQLLGTQPEPSQPWICAGLRAQGGLAVAQSRLQFHQLDAWILYHVLPTSFNLHNVSQPVPVATQLEAQLGNLSFSLGMQPGTGPYGVAVVRPSSLIFMRTGMILSVLCACT